MHGKTSEIDIDNTAAIFKGLPKRIKVARYHSLAADINEFPTELSIIAKTDDNVVMGVKHRQYNLYGLQFHPESILTTCGKTIIKNFFESVKNDK